MPNSYVIDGMPLNGRCATFYNLSTDIYGNTHQMAKNVSQQEQLYNRSGNILSSTYTENAWDNLPVSSVLVVFRHSAVWVFAVRHLLYFIFKMNLS